MRRWSLLLLTAALCAGVFTVSAQPARTPTPAPTGAEAVAEATPEVTAEAVQVELLVPRVLTRLPHDTTAFTQGLVWDDDNQRLFESVGRYGQSDVRLVDPMTGEVLQRTPLADDYFAEGLALVDNQLIQITWQENTAFVYDADTLEQTGTFTYEGEGWGLCYDGDGLWMSDGSSNLFRRDAETFELLDTVPVTLFDDPVPQLNELECVDGLVYANVWQTDFIVRIDPMTGEVTGLIDGRRLLTPEERAALEPGGVLNGIAYLPQTGTFLITGKLWPVLFEVSLETAGFLEPQG